jgi:uncharacterized membrane protein
MEFLLHSLAANVCLGAGLAGLCGFRAFFPVALLGLFSRFGLLGAPDLDGTTFAFMTQTWAIVMFFGLAVLEMGLDKLPLPGLALDFVFNPLRVVAGALVFASAMGRHGTVAIIVGAVAGGIIALVAHLARGALKPDLRGDEAPPTAPFQSLLEDVLVIVGALALMALPWLGIPVLFFVFFLVYRVRVRQRRKYRGLRILKD